MENELISLDSLSNWLKTNERNKAWLSRKLGVSSTLVYFWFSNKRSFKLSYQKKIIDTLGSLND